MYIYNTHSSEIEAGFVSEIVSVKLSGVVKVLFLADKCSATLAPQPLMHLMCISCTGGVFLNPAIPFGCLGSSSFSACSFSEFGMVWTIQRSCAEKPAQGSQNQRGEEGKKSHHHLFEVKERRILSVVPHCLARDEIWLCLVVVWLPMLHQL